MRIIRIAWKILVGIKDALVMLLLLLFFGGLAAILSSRPNAAEVVEGPLVLSIDGSISEQPASIDPIATVLSGAAPMKEYAARDIMRSLDFAATDDRVTAVVLDLDRFLGGGQETLAEIGRKLDAVRKAGKPVHAYAAIYTNGAYQLASHADTIWIDPMGGTMIAPRGGSNLYFADALRRYGVKAHIYRVGTYKAAVEPFMLSEQSEDAAENARTLYGALWTAWRAEVGANRPKAKIDDLVERPAELLEAAKGNAARVALSLGLVDKLATPDEFAEAINRLGGDDDVNDVSEIRGTHYEDYLAALPVSDSGAPIAVIPVAGQIVDGEGGPGGAAGDTVSGLIRNAVDDKVAAIVLRVDSPGGSVPASEAIRRALLRAQKAKIPIVVSMANVAASGGYWISTPATHIFASPATITGSIGVFGILPTFEGTLEKFGVHADGVKLSPLSGQPDLFGGVSPEFDRAAQSLVENVYGRFLSLVAKSRGLDVGRVDEIAQGRVWAGQSARQNGLVDEMGGLDEALAYTAKLTKLGDGDWYARYYEPEPSWLAVLTEDAQATHFASANAPHDAFSLLSAQAIGRQKRAFDNLHLLLSAQSTQALCFSCLDAAPSSATVAYADHHVFSRFFSVFD